MKLLQIGIRVEYNKGSKKKWQNYIVEDIFILTIRIEITYRKHPKITGQFFLAMSTHYLEALVLLN